MYLGTMLVFFLKKEIKVPFLTKPIHAQLNTKYSSSIHKTIVPFIMS